MRRSVPDNQLRSLGGFSTLEQGFLFVNRNYRLSVLKNRRRSIGVSSEVNGCSQSHSWRIHFASTIWPL
jgi:hypothetical protein